MFNFSLKCVDLRKKRKYMKYRNFGDFLLSCRSEMAILKIERFEFFKKRQKAFFLVWPHNEKLYRK